SSQTTQDQYACGEWDYLTYHIIHEHTGLQDSTAMTHGYYRINALEPDSTELIATPMIDQHQRYSVFRTVVGTPVETDHAIGVNDASDATTLNVPAGSSRTQFIIRADELTGLTHIDALRLIAQMGGSAMHRMTIRMMNTSDTLASTFIDAGLTTVYDQPVQLAIGTNTLTLTQPFTWAGAGNNILVDISMEERTGGTAPVLNASETSHNVLHAQREGHLLFNDGRVGIDPSLFSTLNDQITIAFRAFGGPSLPVNNSVLEAFDAQGNRLLNIHLPWGDGTVYWDAGNNGYDRISKAATSAQYQGQWNYWAFTKNINTGSMKIYLNGTLWQSGTGEVKPMSGIASFNLGANGTEQNPYPGEIDDFNVFDTELSQATIQAWANKRVDATHPNYADLLVGLPFDDADTSFTAQNLASNEVPAHLLGHIQHIMTPAIAITKGITSTTVRPDITLVEAAYTSVLDSTLITDDVVHQGVALETFQVQGNAAVPLDTLYGWEGGNETTYAPNGTVASTVAVTGPYTVNHELNYFSPPFEVVKDHEIGRYITPYGINLSLGANGFTWVYDVTDYQYLLHDSVDISAGNQQELLNLKFVMIEGTPPRKVVNVIEPWGPEQSYSYGDLSSDAKLSAVTVALSPQAHQWALRSRITGHGDQSSVSGAQGCCEFKDNTHSLLSNGTEIDSWHIWQTNDCALNPVYPQG
ncbi:MAG: LamG domain-containing protein, partial [Flavobacteriales bacterium]